MSLFFVTGLSGTDKPAVLGELWARGHQARGVDEDGYAACASTATYSATGCAGGTTTSGRRA
jgi:hypothetical protein